MRKIGLLLIIIGILFGLFGVWTIWRDYRYEKARMVAKANIVSVKIEPIRNGLSNILYTLTYNRDGVIDTTEHKITEEWTIKNPLLTIAQLQSQTFYIHYVPRERRSETSFPKRVLVLESKAYPGFYSRSSFGQMFTFILMGFMVRLFSRKQPYQKAAA